MTLSKAARAEREVVRRDLLDNIRAARREVAAAEELVVDAIQEARMYGVTWDDIAELFPVSRGTLARIYDPDNRPSDAPVAPERAETRVIRARKV